MKELALDISGCRGKTLDIKHLIVIWDGITKERGITATGRDLPRASKAESVDIGRGRQSPSRVPSSVGVTSIQEGLVPRLHFGDQRRLLRVGTWDGSKLRPR